MDTLSSSVSTLKIPSLHHPKSHDQLHHYFKNQLLPQQYPHSIASTAKPTTPKTFTTQTKSFISPPVAHPSRASSPAKQSSNSPQLARTKAAAGYAVALLDAARCNDVVGAVARDAKRLSRWLLYEEVRGVMANSGVGSKEKEDVLREIVRRGKFHKYLVKLVKLLVEKSKVAMVSEVLVEFGRICDELSTCNNRATSTATQVVLVPVGMKIEENQVLGIAERVQMLSGAAEVKVRQLVGERILPSLAV